MAAEGLLTQDSPTLQSQKVANIQVPLLLRLAAASSRNNVCTQLCTEHLKETRAEVLFAALGITASEARQQHQIELAVVKLFIGKGGPLVMMGKKDVG